MANKFVIRLWLLVASLYLSIVDGQAATMFLVSGLTGEVSASVPGDQGVALRKGRFLPTGANITTASNGGLELFGGGWTLRLGNNNNFSALEGGIHLRNGAILARPLRSSSELILETDGNSYHFHGKGAFFGELMTDGGLRVIGLTGDTWVSVQTKKGRNQVELNPGQRVECNNKGRIGKTVDLDLAELVQTSRLFSLFDNAPSFSRELARVAAKQPKRNSTHAGAAQADFSLCLSNSTASRRVTEPPSGPAKMEELPPIPGPPIRFHAPPKPFPGRIFDR